MIVIKGPPIPEGEMLNFIARPVWKVDGDAQVDYDSNGSTTINIITSKQDEVIKALDVVPRSLWTIEIKEKPDVRVVG